MNNLEIAAILCEAIPSRTFVPFVNQHDRLEVILSPSNDSAVYRFEQPAIRAHVWHNDMFHCPEERALVTTVLEKLREIVPAEQYVKMSSGTSFSGPIIVELTGEIPKGALDALASAVPTLTSPGQ